MDLTFGNATTFKDSYIASVYIIKLSSTSCLLYGIGRDYIEGSYIYYYYAVVGTVSNTTITFGTFYRITEVNSLSTCMLLDSGNILFVYRKGDITTNCFAKVGSISGTTITFGTEVEFSNTGNGSFEKVLQVSSTKFILSQNQSNPGKIYLFNISGTTITINSSITTDLGSPIRLALISSTQVLVVQREGSASSLGKSFILTISGDTLSMGSITQFSPNNNSIPIDIIVLSSSTFLLAYYYYDSGYYSKVVCGSISGTTITYGSTVTLNATATTYGLLQIILISTNKVLVCFCDNNGIYTAICDVSGTAITLGTVLTITNNPSHTGILYQIATNKILFRYMYDGNTEMVVLSVSTSTITKGDIFKISSVYQMPILSENGEKYFLFYVDILNSTYTSYISELYYDSSDDSVSVDKENVLLSSRAYTNGFTFLDDGKAFIPYIDVASGYYGKSLIGTYTGPITFIPQILFF